MFIDANVFIYAYGESGRIGKACNSLLKKIATGEQNAITSALVINEVFYYFMEQEGLEAVEAVKKHISSLSALTIAPVDDKAVNASLGYMRQGLGVTDAFHAATMRLNGVSVICTYDKGFDKAKGITRQEPK